MTITEFRYLGEYATVMDAEMLAIAMEWRIGRTVATDSQAAIAGIMELQHCGHKSWIEEEVIKERGRGRKELRWVPGHKGILGNEMADYREKQGVYIGKAMGDRNIATPAGIKKHFRITEKRSQVKEWDRDAMRGYTYIYTDKGPCMQWLYKIGRNDSNRFM